MNSSQLYNKWQKRLRQLVPAKCGTRLTNMVWLMVGIYGAKSVHLEQIACHIPLRGKKLSLRRRLRRFIANEAVDVEQWYATRADGLIQSAGSGGKLNLGLDTTKISRGHRLLCIGVAYPRRTLAIWDWVGHRKGHCTVKQQVTLRKQRDARIAVIGRFH